MRSAIAWLGLKQSKKENGDRDKAEASDNKDIKFDTWHSGGKGDGTAPQLNGVRYFSLDELQKCTDNFSETNVIGQGGFGKTYKGFLTNGVVIAIKRGLPESSQGINAFITEIELLSRVHHKNIVSLVGFCFEQGERMPVYEYFCNGSLHDNLHRKFCMHLDWKKRLQIALDSARGLAYLHELIIPQIIHRGVKSFNILLDEHLNAKLSDFGISKLNRGNQERVVSSQDKRTLLRVESRVAGTFGYLAPEYAKTGQLSELCDVFSFGMVMLELITAKRTCYNKDGEFLHLINEVTTAIDLGDQEYYGLRDLIDSKIVDQARNIGIRKFVLLALACTRYHDSDRPFMSKVVREIEMILLQSDGGAATNDDYSDESKYHDSDRQFLSELLREGKMYLFGSDGGEATNDDYSDKSNNSILSR